MALLAELWRALVETCRDVLPITALIVGFQLFVIRQPIPRVRRMIVGYAYVLLGLSLFLVGLEHSLFPVGRLMAQQLTSPEFTGGTDTVEWWSYGWVYLFAAAIGFATTIAEPALLAVAIKAERVSGGTIQPLALRIAVSIGVAVGVALGTFRIVTGLPLVWFIITGYALVVVQTLIAPRSIIPLAYDSGGVTTSTVTVPLVAALGLGLAESVPGRSPVLDGFGLIAFSQPVSNDHSDGLRTVFGVVGQAARSPDTGEVTWVSRY